MQKHMDSKVVQKLVNLVDLVKSFPTNILLQNLASIQERTSPIKFAHLAEKSQNGSISNLSTKGCAPSRAEAWGPAAQPLGAAGAVRAARAPAARLGGRLAAASRASEIYASILIPRRLEDTALVRPFCSFLPAG